MKQLLALIGIILWVGFAFLRGLLVIFGWVFVPFTLVSDGAERTPRLWRPVYGNVEDIAEKAKKNRWTKYVEMAWRNPTNGLKGLIKQPVPEVMPNPDEIVRSGTASSASRWMQHGIYWEYWYLKDYNKKIFGKYYLWWEFRIGWKFVDGNEEFFPTIQLGPRSS